MVRLVALFVVFAVLSGCASTATSPPRPARINHLVFFKLQNPADVGEFIADCDRLVNTMPGVVSYFAGTHFDTGRAMVDGDYDVGFYVGFMSEADYENYLTHPSHVQAVEKWRPRWQWIRVVDVVDESP